MISDAIGVEVVVTVAMAMIENRHSGLIETTTFEYLSPRTQLGSICFTQLSSYMPPHMDSNTRLP